MKVNGKMISNMEKGKKPGQMDLSMRVSTIKERSMAWVSTLGTMAHDMMENGLRIRSEDGAHILGSMAGNIKENGLTITWRVSECTPGKMAEGMKANIKMIKSTDMVSTLGRTCANIRACGSKGSNMALESISCQEHRQSMVSGRMERE